MKFAKDYYLLVEVFQEVFEIFHSRRSYVVVRREPQRISVFVGVNHIDTNFPAAAFQNLDQLHAEQNTVIAL